LQAVLERQYGLQSRRGFGWVYRLRTQPALEVMTVTIQVKRIYDDRSPDDGYRVLVDRLWPRGVTKEAAHIDLWLRDIAPTTELRKWFGHEPGKWPEFRERYLRELDAHEAHVAVLREAERRHGTVTLLFAARDRERNEARVLAQLLSGTIGESAQPKE
jgi:uncharacterized protein YeaO (DUF488 family)